MTSIQPRTMTKREARSKTNEAVKTGNLFVEAGDLFIKQVGELWEGKAWVALGYKSWQDYTKEEFGSDRIKLTGAFRAAFIIGLHEIGMSTREIGAAAGVSHMTVARQLNPEAEILTVKRELKPPSTGKRHQPTAKEEEENRAQNQLVILFNAERTLRQIETQDWRDLDPSHVERWQEVQQRVSEFVDTVLHEDEPPTVSTEEDWTPPPDDPVVLFQHAETNVCLLPKAFREVALAIHRCLDHDVPPGEEYPPQVALARWADEVRNTISDLEDLEAYLLAAVTPA